VTGSDAARVLVLNAGSSSLKASIIELGQRDALASLTADWGADATRVADRRPTIAAALDQLAAAAGLALATDLLGVGHRVVHGGSRFRAPIVVDDVVLAELDALSELAPLHNPVAVDTLRVTRQLLPGQRHVATFDTAFHASLPEAAYVYPLPWQWYAEWGVRRFGFHGLSVAWSVRRAAELLGRDASDLQLVVAHLGSGCSVTAVAAGRSVATSMGLTPLEGLMMGTRAGSFDPGVALRLLDDGRLSVAQLEAALEHRSGLVGVSGIVGGMVEVQAAAQAGNQRARLAVDMFCRRAAEGIAAAATSLDRVDALIFTGGIGEHAAGVRAQIVDRLAALGLTPIGRQALTTDGRLSDSASPVAVLRIEAREDQVIAEAVAAMVS
jgi:acetate kinase